MKHILTISHRRTHTQCPCAYKFLKHFTLADKQHTRTPTCHRESTVFTGLLCEDSVVCVKPRSLLLCYRRSLFTIQPPLHCMPSLFRTQYSPRLMRLLHVQSTSYRWHYGAAILAVFPEWEHDEEAGNKVCVSAHGADRPLSGAVRSCQDQPGPFDYL